MLDTLITLKIFSKKVYKGKYLNHAREGIYTSQVPPVAPMGVLTKLITLWSLVESIGISRY